MENKPIQGILVDLEELEKTPNLVLWGRAIRSDGFVYPHMKLMEISLTRTLKSVKRNGLLIDTYLTFE
jgi:hypothetical protein